MAQRGPNAPPVARASLFNFSRKRLQSELVSQVDGEAVDLHMDNILLRSPSDARETAPPKPQTMGQKVIAHRLALAAAP